MKRLTGARRKAQQAFVDATNAAMRGRRLVEEGDLAGAYQAETDTIIAMERAHDALEECEPSS